MINKNRLIKLTQQLIRINSENPGGTEAKIAHFVQEYLKNCAVPARIYEFKKDRANVVALIKGRDKKQALLITPHLDTVPRGRNWHVPPFSGTLRNGRIYGLGATDCKGNLAVAMEVIKSLFEEKIDLDYNLIFAATADEESGSDLGLIPLLEKKILQPQVAVVLDSDDFDIVVAQKGLIHLKVKIQGKRAHGAYPWRGVNAIDLAVKIIQELKREKFTYRRNKYLRPPTVNVGTIRGGDKVNVVSDWCEFELDFRFLPATSAKDLLRKLKNIIRRQTAKFKIEIEGIQQPYSISENHPLIRQLEKAMQHSAVKPALKGSEGATVITFFQDRKIPATATGFGCEGCAHTTDEYVKVDNLYKGAQILEYFLRHYRFN